MKTLYLMRHAKSSWHDPGLSDFDRPLNPRGLRNAPLVGSCMADKEYVPDLILCSSARRTLETLSLIKPYVGLTIPTHVEDGLYLASGRVLMTAASEVEDDYNSILIIAHNPGLEDCALMLANPRSSRIPIPQAVPTAALCVFKADIPSWSVLSDGQGALLDFITPSQIDRTDQETDSVE